MLWQAFQFTFIQYDFSLFANYNNLWLAAFGR